jgi:glycosylphosphatidylinositol transamidase (GPIT) subunit GPI8
LEFLEAQVKDLSSRKTVGELFDSYDRSKIHSNPGFRYDLFPGGAETARSRLITDFFGNIQNVEVDRAKDMVLEEDLLELSKKIAALQQRDFEHVSTFANVTAAPANAPEAAKKIRTASPLTSDNWLTNKVVGATALAGCALLWGLSSYLET